MNINSRTSSGFRTLERTNLVSPLVTNSLRGIGDNVSIDNFSEGNFNLVSNRFGEFVVNNINTFEPLKSNISNGTAALSISLDPSRLYVDQNQNLSVVAPTYFAPLTYSEAAHSISLLLDDSTLFVDGENKLSVKFFENQSVLDSPLFYNSSNEIELKYASHFSNSEGFLDNGNLVNAGLSLKIADPLVFGGAVDNHRLTIAYNSNDLEILNNELSVVPYSARTPVFIVDKEVRLEIDPNTLQVVNDKLKAIIPTPTTEVSYLFQSPFTTDITPEQITVGFNHDFTLWLNQGALSVARHNSIKVLSGGLGVELSRGLAFTPSYSIEVNIGYGLKFNDSGVLESNVSEIIKPLGAIYTGGILDLAADELLDLGISAFTDYDPNVTLLRLKTSDDFSQKTTVGGFRALTIKNKGANCIPYYGATFDGLNTRPYFTYNETLNTLKVGDVDLDSRFTFSTEQQNYAVTKAFLSQFIQSSATGAIDVAAEVNGRRELLVRYDASLQVDQNNNLGVNPSAIVNGSSVKVDGNGKIASGLIFSAANGLKLRDTTNNDVQLNLIAQGALSMSSTNTITENFTASNGVQRLENDFQSSLTFSSPLVKTGDNVSLNFSAEAPDLTYANGVLTCNIDADDSTTYKIGNIIKAKSVVSGSPNVTVTDTPFAYVVTVLDNPLQTQDDKDEKTTQDVENTLKADPAGNTTITSGPSASVLPPFFGVPPIIPLATVPPITGGGLLPASTFPWTMIFGAIPTKKKKRDVNGDVILDVNGEPTYEDPIDNVQQVEPDTSNVFIVSDPSPLGDCKTTRLLFDTPPACNYRGIQYEYKQQAINLDMLDQYHDEVIKPSSADFVGDLIEMKQDVITTSTNLSIADLILNTENGTSPRVICSEDLNEAISFRRNGGSLDLNAWENVNIFCSNNVLADQIKRFSIDGLGNISLSGISCKFNDDSIVTSSELSNYQPLLTPSTDVIVRGLQTEMLYIDTGLEDYEQRPFLSATERQGLIFCKDGTGRLDIHGEGGVQIYTGNGAYGSQINRLSIDAGGDAVFSGNLKFQGTKQVVSQEWANSTFQPILNSESTLYAKNTVFYTNSGARECTISSEDGLGLVLGWGYTKINCYDRFEVCTGSASTKRFSIDTNGVVNVDNSLTIQGNPVVTDQTLSTSLAGKQDTLTTSSDISINSLLIAGNTVATETWIASQNYATSSALSSGLATKQDIIGSQLSLSNQSSTSLSIIGLTNDTLGGGYLFLNSSQRTEDGTGNMLTLRNDIGPVRIVATGSDIELASTGLKYNGSQVATESYVDTGVTNAVAGKQDTLSSSSSLSVASVSIGGQTAATQQWVQNSRPLSYCSSPIDNWLLTHATSTNATYTSYFQYHGGQLFINVDLDGYRDPSNPTASFSLTVKPSNILLLQRQTPVPIDTTNIHLHFCGTHQGASIPLGENQIDLVIQSLPAHLDIHFTTVSILETGIGASYLT